MTPEFDVHPSLDAVLNDRFRGHDDRDWTEWAERHHVEEAVAIPEDATCAWLSRRKINYRGLGSRTGLKHLVAANADQAFLYEIAELPNLERLELEWPFVGVDLQPLQRLTKLRHLSIDTPRKIDDFAPLAAMPSLRTLLVTNAGKMTDLRWLKGAQHLEVIGIEGAIDKDFTIPSLAPLAGLSGLQAFFGVSTRLADKSLAPLARCPALRYLKVARWAPREAFEELHRACPELVCQWFEEAAWGRAGLRAL